MAYGSSSSKKKKGSALRGLFADPGDAAKQRKREAEIRARRLRMLRQVKGNMNEKERNALLGMLHLDPALPLLLQDPPRVGGLHRRGGLRGRKNK